MAADATRVRFAPAEGAARLFTPTFCEYLARLHDALGARALELRARRDEGLRRALRDHVMPGHPPPSADRKSTRLNSSHGYISYAVFCLKKKKRLATKPSNSTLAG